MKILIATEGSRYGDAALRVAAERPWPAESEFRVLTVIEGNPIYGTVMVTSKVDNDLRRAAERTAISAAATLQELGRKSSHVIRQGEADEEIVNEAKEWRADLILVGTHSRHGISGLLIGSVARNVALQAPCSVEIVKLPER